MEAATSTPLKFGKWVINWEWVFARDTTVCAFGSFMATNKPY